MIRVLIVDDHAVVRKGIRQIAGETRDLTVVGEAANGGEGLNIMRRTSLDVVLLDISMPGMNGLEFIARIKAERPRLPVLVLSLHSEQDYALRAIRAGAAGYFVKNGSPEELITAIRRVEAGRRYVSPELAELLLTGLDDVLQKPLHENLSQREFQIFHLLARGIRIKKIAEELSISPKTVSTYRARILEKLHLETNAQVILYALENGLAETRSLSAPRDLQKTARSRRL